MRSGVEPRHAAAQKLDPERAALEVRPIHIRDLELSASRGLERSSDVEHLVVVEIQTGHGVVGFRLLGLFLDIEGVPLLVELNHAVALGVTDTIGKNSRALLLLCGGSQLLRESMAVENVIAQHQRDTIAAHEPLANNKSLRQALRPGLLGVT